MTIVFQQYLVKSSIAGYFSLCIRDPVSVHNNVFPSSYRYMSLASLQVHVLGFPTGSPQLLTGVSNKLLFEWVFWRYCTVGGQIFRRAVVALPASNNWQRTCNGITLTKIIYIIKPTDLSEFSPRISVVSPSKEEIIYITNPTVLSWKSFKKSPLIGKVSRILTKESSYLSRHFSKAILRAINHYLAA